MILIPIGLPTRNIVVVAKRNISVIYNEFELKSPTVGVNNVFLSRNLDEEVYTNIPSTFSSLSIEGKVCRLKKPLY